MFSKALAGATLSLLALGSLAAADESAFYAPLQLDEAPASTPAAPSAPVTPIMQTPFGTWLAQYELSVTGYAEAGYFDDLSHPGNTAGVRTIAGDHVGFPGAYKEQIILDQLDLQIARNISDPSKGFDVGFMIEGNYGRDDFFTHSHGILDNNNQHGGGANDQLDLEQAYLTVGIPVGTGLTIKAGKFVTLFGNETINPTTNQFYTHSYNFSYGIPYTQTGVLGSYNVTDEWAVTGGITRGWNQSTSDNNGAIDGLFETVYTPTNKLSFTFNGAVGPEGVPGTLPYGPSDNSDYWFVPELIGKYQVSDEFNVALDGLYGYANRFSQWYGVAGYAGYTFNKYATLNGRIEWYNDGHGLTTGVPLTTNYGEATVGVQVKPFPDDAIGQFLQVRPEVRYDIADRSVFDGHAQQLSLGIDVIMQF